MVTVNEIIDTHARIAVYDDMLSSPRIIDVSPAPTLEFMEEIASKTYEHARAQGGSLPYTVIREIAENFIHAEFKECTVSVLYGGNTIRFSDQGPGIEKKELVMQPGISSATASMKQYIRGVGSGFPIVREYLERVNGYLSIDDNAVDGVVITLTILPPEKASFSSSSATHTSAAQRSVTRIVQQTVPQTTTQERFLEANGDNEEHRSFVPIKTEILRSREEQALFLLYKEGMLGSGDLVEPLGISAPTATRLLQRLEELGFVEVSLNKKRILSNKGLAYVELQDKTDDQSGGHGFNKSK